MIKIEESQDVFNPKKVNLVKRWSDYFNNEVSYNETDRIIEVDQSPIDLRFVKITKAKTIPDGNYVKVTVEGPEGVDEENDRVYFFMFADITKPAERHNAPDDFFAYLESLATFKCTNKDINTWVEEKSVEYVADSRYTADVPF